MMLIDNVILTLILLASFSIRLGYWYFPDGTLLIAVFGAPILAIIVFTRFGLYRSVIRYIGFNALWSVFQAVSLYAILWGAIGFFSALDGIPRSVILINWSLSLLALVGLRVGARWLFTKKNTNKLN